jgi:acyl carrier protein
MTIGSVPLNANGKLDRRRLPAPGAQPSAHYVPPRTPAEELLAALWADVLPVDRLGVEDNFFENGGHSLLATRIIAGVARAFGVQVPLRTLFEAPTVAALARVVEAALIEQIEALSADEVKDLLAGDQD